jgi:homeobox protein engrailed
MQDVKPAIILHHPLPIYPSTFALQASGRRRPSISPRPPAAQDGPGADQPAPLRFSVSNILRPEFGRRAVDESRLRPALVHDVARSRSSRCSSVDECRSFTSSPISHRPCLSPPPRKRALLDDSDKHSNGDASSICSSSRPTSSLEEKLADPAVPGKDQGVWPAWVFCTRYSDRPSSGNYFFL